MDLMSILTGGLGYIIPFLIVLTVLVFVHELGHYLVARRNGVKIEVFSIGFGPEIFGWFDRAGTRWKLSAVPLGGYVKMYGDADASSLPSGALEVMSEADRAVSFHHKRLSQRVAVVAAGPVANFLFAIVLLAALFSTVGQPFTPPDVGQVQAGSAAERGGIKPGDTITEIDGSRIQRFEDVQQAVALNGGAPMRIVVHRDGQDITLDVTPQMTERTDRFGNVHRIGLLGIGRSGVAIVWFMAVLSVNLGLINLFPIPVLDGGHLLFYVAEAIRGRPLGQRAQEYGFRIGLALVLTLMVFTTWNDLVHIG